MEFIKILAQKSKCLQRITVKLLEARVFWGAQGVES
jgi:hypothetical protein